MVVAALFCALLLRRFSDRRLIHEGLWGAALLMYAAASLAMFLGVVRGWASGDFRVYWLLGAVLNVPFLALGELYLLIRRRAAAHALLALLLVGTTFAAWNVARAPIHAGALARSLPLGKEVFGAGRAPYRIAQLYAWPAYLLLLGGLMWSAWQLKGRPDLKDRTVGVLGIAFGATIVAIGSGIGAGFDVVPLFSVSLAVGIAVMFWGFLRAGRPRSPAPARPAASATVPPG